jgi:hypothetical protein
MERMYAIAEAAQPINGRGVGYKLFVPGLIPDMSRKSMGARRASWTDPADYVRRWRT